MWARPWVARQDISRSMDHARTAQAMHRPAQAQLGQLVSGPGRAYTPISITFILVMLQIYDQVFLLKVEPEHTHLILLPSLVGPQHF